MSSTEIKLILKTSLLSAIFTVVLFMLVNFFFTHSWSPVWSSTSKNPTLNVQGTGTLTETPDQSQVSFTVTKTASTVQAAQTQANTSMDKILTDLQNGGVAKNNIQTSNYNSSPNYDDSGNTIQSYTVSEDVDVTMHDNTLVNKVIDIATKDGAEDISGPDLSFSDGKQQELQNEARVKAIQDAKQKAQSMADAAGIHLGRLVNIQENTNPVIYPVRPLPMIMKGVATGGNVPTQINPGQNTVTSTVTLSYETY